jgi:hypothetical protein
MKLTELRNLIREQVQLILTEDAFRRIVIKSSTKIPAIKKEIEMYIARPEVKKEYPSKITIKPGANPDVLVVDISGENATTLGIKIADQAKKIDKQADVKTRKELKLVSK